MSLQIVRNRVGRRGRQYGPETIRRFRAMVDEVGRHEIPITARHLFYRLVSRGDIEKSDTAYERLCRDLVALRRSGDIPWEMITDGTRTKTKWEGVYGDLQEAAEEWRQTYRRDIWRNNPIRCEVWTESRGLLDTINEVAGEYGVTTFGVGGFNSVTVGWQTAQDVTRAIGLRQRYVIFHFGDHDPSGEKVGYAAERHVRSHLTDRQQGWFRYVRVALTRDQVAQYALPTALVELDKHGNVRGGHGNVDDWKGGKTELDALDPRVIQQLVRGSIESIIDWEAYDAAKAAEVMEREALDLFVAGMRGAA